MHPRQSATFESLEARQLMSAAFPLVHAHAMPDGSERLSIIADGEHVRVSPISGGVDVTADGDTQFYSGNFGKIALAEDGGNNRLVVANGVSIDAVLRAGSGNDTLVGGGGNTTLYAGSGRDSLIGRTGNTTMIAVGGGADSLAGGAGQDSFWFSSGDVVSNVTPAERAIGAVHQISAFAPLPAAGTLPDTAGAMLPEPAVTGTGITYKDFHADPLFGAAGPNANDIQQGQLGDCYFLATLSAIVKADPRVIEQSITRLADGTYVVDFHKDGANVFEHVDAMLPTYSDGRPAYAQLGHGDAMWAAIMEKAFTFFRDGAGRYSDIEAGWMSEVFTDLGLSSSTAGKSKNADDLSSLLQSELNQDEAVTIAVLNVPNGAPLIADHAYSVDAIVMNPDGSIAGIRLRNPWGIDGAGDDGDNDGYVTITPAQAYAAFEAVIAAKV